jgi:hypothetical protein
MEGSLLFGLGFFFFLLFVAVIKGLWDAYRDYQDKARLAYIFPAKEYRGLRNQIFDGTLKRELVPTDLPPDEPWSIVMDWGVKRGVATIVAFRDGTASMYYSSGGGNIGGGQADAAILAAAKNALTVGAKCLGKLKLATEFPTPTKPGQVFFYVLTSSGIYFGEGSQKELGANQHPLSELGNAMQAIVTGYRLHKPKRK